jgi:hypothetical protein
LILYQQFFSLPKAFHTKKPKVKASSHYSKAKSSPKPKAKPPKGKKKKKTLAPSGVFYSSKQGGATGRGMTLQQEI